MLSPGFLASYLSVDLGHFFRYQPLLPMGWRTVQIVRQRQRKMTNTATTSLSAIQAASKSTSISMYLRICRSFKSAKHKKVWSANRKSAKFKVPHLRKIHKYTSNYLCPQICGFVICGTYLRTANLWSQSVFRIRMPPTPTWIRFS